MNRTTTLRRQLRKQRQAQQQKQIAFFFCMIIALAVVCSVLFSSITAEAAPSEVSSKYYTSIQIESGDTLWEIATEYISDEYTDIPEYIREVCSINHISEDEIHAGQYIVVPYYTAELTR